MGSTAYRDAVETIRECWASIERADYLDIRHVTKDIRIAEVSICCLPVFAFDRATGIVPAIAAAEASEGREDASLHRKPADDVVDRALVGDADGLEHLAVLVRQRDCHSPQQLVELMPERNV